VGPTTKLNAAAKKNFACFENVIKTESLEDYPFGIFETL
jgi:hypothetical protein